MQQRVTPKSLIVENKRRDYGRVRNHLDVCLAVRICGDNGISRDSLDVCFGDQLAGFVTLGTYA